MNYSFWEKYFIESPTDITIIGAGIVGLSTAISIKESNPEASVKILERSSSPNGASTKNAGFSCFGSVSELLDDIKHTDENTCMEIVQMRYNGLKMLKARVPAAIMEYQHVGGTELFKKDDKATIDQCIAQIPYLNQLMENYLGIKDCYNIQKNRSLSPFHLNAIYNQYEGIINPVKTMNYLHQMAINKGVQILYGIEIQNIDQHNHILETISNLNIHYKKLILCTNGFTKRLFPEIEVIPARNQVLITKPLPDNPLHSGYHFDRGYIYFRAYEGRILLGGGRNMDLQGETTDEFGHTDIIQTYLLDKLDEIYPGATKQIDTWWSGIMGLGSSKRPLTIWVDDNIIAGVRLGGMGVAIGSYLGAQLANMIIQSQKDI